MKTDKPNLPIVEDGIAAIKQHNGIRTRSLAVYNAGFGRYVMDCLAVKGDIDLCAFQKISTLDEKFYTKKSGKHL